jgi:hypothetical protein
VCPAAFAGRINRAVPIAAYRSLHERNHRADTARRSAGQRNGLGELTTEAWGWAYSVRANRAGIGGALAGATCNSRSASTQGRPVTYPLPRGDAPTARRSAAGCYRATTERSRERERERDVSAALTHLATAPLRGATTPITSVLSGLTRTHIPFTVLTRPLSQETLFALNAGHEMPDPNPILCSASVPPTTLATATNQI